MLITIEGFFKCDHPSFEDEFDVLQKIPGVTIYEIQTVSYPMPDVMYILFKRDLACIAAEWVQESEIDAFIERINAFESFELESFQKEVLSVHQGPYSIAEIFRLPYTSDAQNVREGQRIHQPHFSDGDFTDVEVTRESVLIEEVMARIDKALAEDSE